MTEIKKYGNKEDVFEGRAQMTRGKLTKDDLYKDNKGTIKSKKQNKVQLTVINKLKNLDLDDEPEQEQEQESEVHEEDDSGEEDCEPKKYAIPLESMTVDALKNTIQNLSKNPVKGLYKLKKQELIDMLVSMGYTN